MGLFLLRFWPVLIPLLVYWLWHKRVVGRAKKTGDTPPHFRDGPWYQMVLASLLIGIGCLLFLAASIDNNKGEYTPSHMQGGIMIPGQVGHER